MSPSRCSVPSAQVKGRCSSQVYPVTTCPPEQRTRRPSVTTATEVLALLLRRQTPGMTTTMIKMMMRSGNALEYHELMPVPTPAARSTALPSQLYTGSASNEPCTWLSPIHNHILYTSDTIIIIFCLLYFFSFLLLARYVPNVA